jgi:sigma-B regulation protein RsbU (phosphoserine phosphatase)
VIADVSGHGVSAGLFMSMFKVLLKTHAAPELEPFSILQKINNSLLIETNSEHFVTTFFGIFNKETRELKYSNAGHVPIFIMANGNISSLNSNGIFVGAIDNMSGGTESVYLSKNSRIFLYTDGLSECLNSKGQQFSIERISSHLLEYPKLTCKQFVQTLLGQARDFSYGDKMLDDITLLCVDI